MHEIDLAQLNVCVCLVVWTMFLPFVKYWEPTQVVKTLLLPTITLQGWIGPSVSAVFTDTSSQYYH